MGSSPSLHLGPLHLGSLLVGLSETRRHDDCQPINERLPSAVLACAQLMPLISSAMGPIGSRTQSSASPTHCHSNGLIARSGSLIGPNHAPYTTRSLGPTSLSIPARPNLIIIGKIIIAPSIQT